MGEWERIWGGLFWTLFGFGFVLGAICCGAGLFLIKVLAA